MKLLSSFEKQRCVLQQDMTIIINYHALLIISKEILKLWQLKRSNTKRRINKNKELKCYSTNLKEMSSKLQFNNLLVAVDGSECSFSSYEVISLHPFLP